AERLQPAVEVALHPVLQHNRAVLVLALRVVGARAAIPAQEVVLRILIDDARNVRGIDDDRALGLEDGNGVVHRLLLIGIQAVAAASTPTSASSPIGRLWR